MIEHELKERQAFRAQLVQLEQKAQEAYDKYLVAMSTGALGLSFVFTRDLVTDGHAIRAELLYCSWIAWALALSFGLASFYVSTLAIRRAIESFDRDGTIESGFDAVVKWLNPASGIAFLLGVAAFIGFAVFNT